MLVMQIVGLASEDYATPFDGQYLKEYDPLKNGYDPNGYSMLAHVVTTTDINDAMQFKDIFDLHMTWTKVDTRKPLRDDGLPNRPLTAFTVQSVEIPLDENEIFEEGFINHPLMNTRGEWI